LKKIGVVFHGGPLPPGLGLEPTQERTPPRGGGFLTINFELNVFPKTWDLILLGRNANQNSIYTGKLKSFEVELRVLEKYFKENPRDVLYFQLRIQLWSLIHQWHHW